MSERRNDVINVITQREAQMSLEQMHTADSSSCCRVIMLNIDNKCICFQYGDTEVNSFCHCTFAKLQPITSMSDKILHQQCTTY